jgi:hypothetical protein
MSPAQALSSFATLAVSFSKSAFPTSACAEAVPIDEMASHGKAPRMIIDLTVILIDTSSDDWLRTARSLNWLQARDER